MLDDLKMLPTLIRELMPVQPMVRVPEPEVMDNPESVSSYADGGRTDSIMVAANIYHAAKATQVLQGCKQVLDLGCGPCTQLVRIAQANPEIQFIGIDLSEGMLDNGQQYIDSLGIKNIDLIKESMTDLKSFKTGSVDGIISQMSFHHLPSCEHLKACFKEINRVLKPSGALYLVDFMQLKSNKSVHFFAYKHQEALPPAVCKDYEYSLKAAFSESQYKALAPNLAEKQAKFYKTFAISILMMIKTADKPISDKQVASFQLQRQSLSKPFRKELDDMRKVFRIEGVKNDIF